MDALEWLQQWYLSQCDGDWEHDSGRKPGRPTEDGGGETGCAGPRRPGGGGGGGALTLERITVERTDDNWYHAWIENNKLGWAGPPRGI
ncbi:MAG: hypothetical protein IPG69_01210 [Flavobacteriales bacterium]|nr:hypothetical protein [Flavobacteriales bacterium]